MDWCGIGEDYALWSDTPLEDWEILLEEVKPWRFNTMRLAFRFADAPATTHTPLDITLLRQVIALLSDNGIGVILDMHNWKDHYGYFGSDKWINNWRFLAGQFYDDKRIVAFELFNEPEELTYDVGMTKIDVISKLIECTNAIHAVDPNRIIIYPDPWYYDPAGPENIGSNVVVSFHRYCNVDNVAAAKQQAQSNFAYMMQTWASQVPIWFGETCPMPDIDRDISQVYTVELINLCLAEGIGFNFWIYTSQPDWYNMVLQKSNYQPEEEVPETIFDAIWASFQEFLEQLGLPVPPKPQLPPLPFES